MRHIVFIFLMLFITAGLMTPAQAQVVHNDNKAVVIPWFSLGDDATTALLGDTSVLDSLQSVSDYANLFYSNCVNINPDKNMDEYVEAQCACAAAKMSGVLSLAETRTMFDPRTTDFYPFTRFMVLAYNECLPDTMRDIVYDNCLSNPFGGRKMRARGKTCACIAAGMKEHVKEFGQYLVPGNTGDVFDPRLMPANPLVSVMGNGGFQIKSEYFETSCLQREEYGW